MALQRKADRIQLATPGGAEEAEMDGHDPQGPGGVEVDDHRSARFMPRQVQPVEARKVDAGPGKKRIAVPAEAYGNAPDRQR